MVTCGAWAGSTNLLTKKQVVFYIGAQGCGAGVATIFVALCWSFHRDIAFREAFPSVPAKNILGWEWILRFGVAKGWATGYSVEK